MKNHKIQTIKEMNRTYLVIQETEEHTETDYQMRMAAEADIPVFLPVQIRQIDCDQAYYYDISGKASLEEWTRHRLVTRQELQVLFQALNQAYDTAESYLLDADRICLSPACIMVNGEWSQVQFCYTVMEEGTFTIGLQALMQFLLTRLDHQDKETVFVGYTLYQYCRQDQCTIGEMLQVFDIGKMQKAGQHDLWNPYPDTEADAVNAVYPEDLWEEDMTVVLSEAEARERLLAVPAEGNRESSCLRQQNRGKGKLGWQWLAVSILAGVLALLGGLYCLQYGVSLRQNGGGLLILGVLALAAESIWGICRFYRSPMLKGH